MADRPFFIPTLPHLLANPGEPFIHRDMSGLQFNERVLAEARSSSNPLLERLKFLAISASNLDEFFMIRYASLDRSLRASSGKSAREKAHRFRVRNALLEAVATFAAKQSETFDLLSSALEPLGVRFIVQPPPGSEAFDTGREIFHRLILPGLPPPEVFRPSVLSQLETLQTGAVFNNNLWLKIPRNLPRIMLAPVPSSVDEMYVFFLDDLLLSHGGPAFRLPGAPGLVRLTRDGDILLELEEEDTSVLPDAIRSGLGRRNQGRPVRFQYSGDMPGDLISRSLSALKLSPRQAFAAPGTLHLHALWTVVRQLPRELREKPGLSLPPLTPRIPAPFQTPATLFDELKKRDLLLHHPYDSFDAYVNFIRAACQDTLVTLIQQTVYRMDADSPVIGALKEAARRKKIRVIIELRARFDELNNLRLADELRQAGVEVAFGFGRLKLHAKVAVVVREEADGVRTYTHLSTGNYNAATARQYEDLAILTSNPDLGEDARKFFDSVCAGQMPSGFKHLVHAPTQLHKLLLQLIQKEIEAAQEGKSARIIAKVNALVDVEITQALYQASQAGVTVDLIVRGACSLIPGVKGLSDNIRVVSLVDRFLEHSRIYSFSASDRLYLSSADWMPRNFFSRLELAFPLLDPVLHKTVKESILPVYLADTVKARELTPQGTWEKRSSSSLRDTRPKPAPLPALPQPLRVQFHFEELAKT